MCLTYATPRAVALRILQARYETPPDEVVSAYSLAEFQHEAVIRARQIIGTRGGVIVADSVGLGKTFVAAGIIEGELAAGRPVAVVVPAATRPVWVRALRPLITGFPRDLHLVTHTQLSRRPVLFAAALIVVDEAHAFRNPATRRYRALRLFCRSAKVVLLTATPVNNSLSDLYFQLRLFARDDAFRDIGIGSLAAVLQPGSLDEAAFSRLSDTIVIRRTRSMLQTRFGGINLPNGTPMRFPQQCVLEKLSYPPLLPFQDVERLINALSFAAHGSPVTALLLRLALLKRMQSSRQAALSSVERLQQFNQRYLAALEEGKLLRPRSLRTEDIAEQLVFNELLLADVEKTFDTSAAAQHVNSDLAVLNELAQRLRLAHDAKLERLQSLLDTRRSRSTLVFTEFRDTAREIWRRLQNSDRTGLITGSEAFLGANPASRIEVIRRFAPRSNHAPTPSPHEVVNVLIATDVLAEGMNLQDADVVVSYDLPWNPVRLIQRAGRIDRMGSDHEVIKVYNFVPDREFDRFLGLVRRLRAKLLEMRVSVGQEGAVLDPDELAGYFTSERQPAPDSSEQLRSEWARERTGAAPAGLQAATSPATGARVLVVWTNGRVLREHVVAEGTVTEDRLAADRILAAGLLATCGHGAALKAAVEASRACLEYEEMVGRAGARDTTLLARAVRAAIARLGLLAKLELLELAEQALQALPGYLGNSRADAALLHGSNTPSETADCLRKILAACTPDVMQNAAVWELVGALAAD